MTTDGFEELIVYLDKLPTQISTGSIFSLSLKREGDFLNFALPNIGVIKCHREQLKGFAFKENLPESLSRLTALILEKRIDCPSDFFKFALTALALENGHGIVELTFPDSRAFIGTVALSYRGHRKKQPSA